MKYIISILLPLILMFTIQDASDNIIWSTDLGNNIKTVIYCHADNVENYNGYSVTISTGDYRVLAWTK